MVPSTSLHGSVTYTLPRASLSSQTSRILLQASIDLYTPVSLYFIYTTTTAVYAVQYQEIGPSQLNRHKHRLPIHLRYRISFYLVPLLSVMNFSMSPRTYTPSLSITDTWYIAAVDRSSSCSLKFIRCYF